MFIKGDEVERVDEHRYLGITFDNKLKFEPNTRDTIKKVQSRMYCLRKLRSFNVNKNILTMFYNACVSSVLFFGVMCWGGSVNDKDRDRIDKLIRKAESVTEQKHDTLDRIYHKRVTKKTKNILNDKTHPLVGEFDSRLNVRSGRLRLPTIRTERYRKSFFLPRAISIFNSDHHRSSK